MKIILLFIFILFNACIQNLQKCPMDTLSLKKECEADIQKKNQETLSILAIGARLRSSSTSSVSSTLTGKALEFHNILVSYRTNGTYTLSNGTTRSFLNASKCSGTTSENGALIRAAQKHTENMIRGNFFAHQGQDGSSPSDRVRAEGLNVGAGENIAAGQTTAESVFDAWWNSSGHRSNMESCGYTHIGIGYANKSSINANASYSDYWTNVFATIR